MALTPTQDFGGWLMLLSLLVALILIVDTVWTYAGPDWALRSGALLCCIVVFVIGSLMMGPDPENQ